MKIYSILLGMLLLTVACTPGKLQTGITLQSLEGEVIAVDSAQQHRLTAYIFLAPACPLSETYTQTINTLREQYGKDVFFAGVIPGNLYNTEEIIAFRDSFQVAFPIFPDPEKKLTHYLDAHITPEVFLLDSKGTLIYSGAIDNRAIELTRLRLSVTEPYLQDAIKLALNNQEIIIRKTQAVGCTIE
jgi:hypothetical protein